MSEPVAQTTAVETPSESDLVAAVRTVLEKSDEPLTLSKIRAALPAALRGVSLEALEEVLQRQVGANALYQYPRYRSQQKRYWDRPMPVHVAHLLRVTLAEEPLGLPELRRKMPDYAKTLTESVLNDQVAQGRLFQHPPATKRTGPRFGVARPEPKEYLRQELTQAFQRLEQLGFTQAQLREGALELLHEEEWAEPPQKREGETGESMAGAHRPADAGQADTGVPRT
jgi:hypothetical protein